MEENIVNQEESSAVVEKVSLKEIEAEQNISDLQNSVFFDFFKALTFLNKEELQKVSNMIRKKLDKLKNNK